MNNDKSYFGLKEFGGLIYPIVKRKRGKTKIDECPYCGEQHTHSLTIGHKQSHCKEVSHYLEEIEIAGKRIPLVRGYFVVEY